MKFACQVYTTVIVVISLEPKIRLSGSNFTNAGRVEIRYGGVWGTVCAHGWDRVDADVACKWLGYTGSVSAFLYPVFGRGKGPVWLTEISCQGTEDSLDQCSHAEWAGGECSYESVGLLCKTSNFTHGKCGALCFVVSVLKCVVYFLESLCTYQRLAPGVESLVNLSKELFRLKLQIRITCPNNDSNNNLIFILRKIHFNHMIKYA